MNLHRKEIYMAKETQKAQIDRILRENEDLRLKLIESHNQLNESHNELKDIKQNLDNKFMKSPLYKQLIEENERLAYSANVNKNRLIKAVDIKKSKDDYIQELKNENELLKEKNSPRIPNERGAGRKTIFDDKTRSDIRKKRDEGATIKKLAQEYGCSVGLIHKLISESKE